ncbi:MAG: YceI family protein [Cytophagaceae bacterium]|nr:YceI family protein [Cytophagaceae bacterium]
MRKLNIIFCLLTAGIFVLACEKKGQEGQQDTTKKDTIAKGEPAAFAVDTAQSIIKWKGKKVTGSHNGTIKIQSGELKTMGNVLVGGSIIIDMNSIANEDIKDKKDNAKLIGHLKDTSFFGVNQYPTATFEITDIQPGPDGKDIINGNLTLKGKAEKISVTAENKIDGDKAKSKGSAVLDRTKWNVRFGSKKFGGMGPDNFIYDEIEMEFEIVANKK